VVVLRFANTVKSKEIVKTVVEKVYANTGNRSITVKTVVGKVYANTGNRSHRVRSVKRLFKYTFCNLIFFNHIKV